MRREAAEAAMEGFFRSGMAQVADAEARLSAARDLMDAADRRTLVRLVMDVEAGLLLLRAGGAGDLCGSDVRREGGRLALALPTGLMDRLPAAARLGALELAALSGRVAARLATEGGSAGTPGPQREKPRRRPARPRLRIVSAID